MPEGAETDELTRSQMGRRSRLKDRLEEAGRGVGWGGCVRGVDGVLRELTVGKVVEDGPSEAILGGLVFQGGQERLQLLRGVQAWHLT